MKSLEICVLYYVMKTINVYLYPSPMGTAFRGWGGEFVASVSIPSRYLWTGCFDHHEIWFEYYLMVWK